MISTSRHCFGSSMLDIRHCMVGPCVLSQGLLFQALDCDEESKFFFDILYDAEVNYG